MDFVNLAGNHDCDGLIARELRRARIPQDRCARVAGEVPYAVVGRLPGFVFTRAWTYWVVEGRVPLAVARELYEDPLGRDDVRVAGHCGRPPPEDPWLVYVGADGKKLLKRGTNGLLEGDGEVARRVNAQMLAEYRWVDDRAAEAAEVFVELYHVDGEAGLRLFADAVRDLYVVRTERRAP